MALALLLPNSNVIFLDAVQNYTRSRSSDISTHPIDKSASVSDHISKSPINFTLQATVSSADFNSEFSRTGILTDYDADLLVNNPARDISIQGDYPLANILPGFISNTIFDKNAGNIDGDTFRGYTHQDIRDALEECWDKQYNITLLDYDYDIALGRSVSIRVHDNLFITNYTDNEDVQTGDSLEFTISFQKIRFALLKEVDISVSKVPDQSAKESNQGNESNIEDDVDDGKKLNSWNREGGFRDQILSVFPGLDRWAVNEATTE